VSAQGLDQPVVSASALRSVNFFNGRLLTGDDLQREQATNQARLARVGRADGEGVAYGLEVTPRPAASTNARPVVQIAPGLALSRSGIALELSAPVEVSLLHPAPSSGSQVEPGNLFAECQPAAPGTYTAGSGVYVLVVRPAQTGEGRAQVSGLARGESPCTVSLSVETVAFRLIRLALAGSELSNVPLLRNRVAYECFGVTEAGLAIVDPFAAPPGWSLIDALRTQVLGDDEVPLATIGWSIDAGIEFIDLWSVRRRLTRPPVEDAWALLSGDRPSAKGEAMFLQFQEQLADLMVGPSAESVTIADSFEYLPPAGIVPVASAGALRPGIDPTTFFAGTTTRAAMVLEGAKVPPLLRRSFQFPPIVPASRELIWLYEVRENRDPGAWTAGAPGGPYLLFTTGFMRYAAQPQFDLSRWDYADFALHTD
jgi:hypothetical protein